MNKKTILLAALFLSTQRLFSADCCEEPKYSSTPCCEKELPCAYTPPWKLNDCAGGLSISADFLYWYALQDELPYGYALVTQELGAEEFILAPSESLTIDSEWAPGLRIGAGKTSREGNWDVFASWTYFKNSQRETTAVAPFAEGAADIGAVTLFHPWLSNGFGGIGATTEVFNQLRGRWEFTYNRFSFEFGRRYWTGSLFTIRPYVGIDGYWTRARFLVRGSQRDNVATNETYAATTHMKNDNWGVGILAGIQPAWNFTEQFSLYSNFDFALDWGRFERFQKEERIRIVPTATDTFKASSSYSSYEMQPILDLSLGLRFERFWCEDLYHMEICLGWEHHFLYRHNFYLQKGAGGDARYTATDDLRKADSIFENAYDVSFGGFVLRARFDF